MKKIIKKLVPSLVILLLAVSLIFNWVLLNHNIHQRKTIDNLNTKLEQYEEDYIKYSDLYNDCEFNLNETMKTLEATTKELQSLKKN